MTQEEKAKRYDEALRRARKLKEDPTSVFYEYSPSEGDIVVDYIFPELKESEDERIRMSLIELFKDMEWDDSILHDYNMDKDKTISWLEKQHIQKQETSYPKFDFDDILALQCCMETAEKVTEDKELYKKLQSLHSRLHDAYWLEKQGEEKQDPCEHCDDKRLNCHNFPCVKKKAFEQGKSALEVINEEDVDNDNKVEQNPAWSEEDKEILRLSLENLTELKDRFGKDYGRVGDCINCLKSLKDRYAWRASWEQLDALEYHLKHTNENSWQYKETKKLYDQLKKL